MRPFYIRLGALFTYYVQFYLPITTLRTDAIGSEAIWKWVQREWEAIEAKLHASIGIMGTIVGIMLRGLSSQKNLGEIEVLFKRKDTSTFEKQLALVLDSLKANVAWVERDGEDVRQWLRDNGYYA